MQIRFQIGHLFFGFEFAFFLWGSNGNHLFRLFDLNLYWDSVKMSNFFEIQFIGENLF